MFHLPNGIAIVTNYIPNSEPAGPLPPPRTVREFIERECFGTDVSVKDVYGKSRKTKIVRIRQRAMHFGVRQLGMPSTKVGRILKRDHTTVLHGVRVVEQSLSS